MLNTRYRILNTKKGFTLIELLIVVGVLGILSGVIISVINPERFRGRARDAVRKNDLAVVKGAIELYYAENNTYPGTGTINFLIRGSSWIEGGVTYLRSVPQDPKFKMDAGYPNYCYEKDNPSAGNYVLCAKVEDANSASVPSGVATCGGVSVANTPGTHYCVQNPF